MVTFETLQQNLRRFNVNRQGTRPSILGGVKRKSKLAVYTRCTDCGLVWLDKVYAVPHYPTCPNGHKQLKTNGEPHCIFNEDELGALRQYSLMHDIAAGGELGIREGFTKEVITSEQFFEQWGFTKDGKPIKNPTPSP